MEAGDSHLIGGGRRTSALFMQDEWVPGLHYHLIGKAVPGELLFREARDYRRFLRKSLRDRLQDVFEFHSYNLIPNHFHAGVRARYDDVVRARLASARKLTATDRAYLEGEISYADFVAERFRGAIMRHAKYYNYRYDREGQLFMKPSLHGLTTKADEPGVAYSRKMNAYIALNHAKHRMTAADGYYHWRSLHNNLYQIVELDFEMYYGSVEAYKAYLKNYMAQYGARLYDFEEEAFFQTVRPRRYVTQEQRWIEEEWRTRRM